MFLPHPRVKVSIVGSLRDREVACSASDRRGSNFESCIWRTVSSQSSHHLQKVLLAQFSLYVHKGGLKPDSFHFWDQGRLSGRHGILPSGIRLPCRCRYEAVSSWFVGLKRALRDYSCLPLPITLLCKAKRQYMLTCKVIRYCPLTCRSPQSTLTACNFSTASQKRTHEAQLSGPERWYCPISEQIVLLILLLLFQRGDY